MRYSVQKREVRGIVYAVEYTDKEGNLLTPGEDAVDRAFEKEGWEVQSVRLGIDGHYLVEVRL